MDEYYVAREIYLAILSKREEVFIGRELKILTLFQRSLPASW